MTEQSAEIGEFACELDVHIAESMKDPEYAAALIRARERASRAVALPCAWGYCTNEVVDGRILSGCGPMMCPCDHSPGWRSDRPAGQAKPHVPVKATGRHGSRRHRAHHRQASLPDYGPDFPYLPGISTPPGQRPPEEQP